MVAIISERPRFTFLQTLMISSGRTFQKSGRGSKLGISNGLNLSMVGFPVKGTKATKETKGTWLFDINSGLRLDSFVNGIGSDELAVLFDHDLRGDGARAVEKNRNFLSFG